MKTTKKISHQNDLQDFFVACSSHLSPFAISILLLLPSHKKRYQPKVSHGKLFIDFKKLEKASKKLTNVNVVKERGGEE